MLLILILAGFYTNVCNSMIGPSLFSSQFTARCENSNIIGSLFRESSYASKNYRCIVNGNSYLCAVHEAVFGMGCFWEPSERMRKVDGVLDTVVGYAGGSLGGGRPIQPPTYDEVCYGDAWVESVMVAYDDEVISYEKLLESFWEVQKPREGERQYQSIIFPFDHMQFEAAQKWVNDGNASGRKRASDGLPISVVDIEYNSKSRNSIADRSDGVLFYQAEEYHQEFWKKWRLRIAVAVFLMSTSVDLSIVNASLESQSQWKIGTLTLLGVGGFYYGIIERIIDDSVREVLPGTFAISALEARSRRRNKRTQSRE